ncbi:MAG: UDP-N-acetylmuramate--L-alanine ligase [Fusobacteriaceae bacterium]
MKKIFFIGINGIGMSGLAKIMKIKGYEIAGSDPSRNYITEELENLGIKVYSKHESENVKGYDTIIASSAIKQSNPEYAYAIENNIKIIKRGELLAKLLDEDTGIAVAGTHGKTTTSSMLSAVMLEKDPTIVVGGVLPEIGSNAKAGKSEYFIAEADESDNSFLYMHPKYSIILNIEADHLENHGSLENIERSFNQFINQTEKEILVCFDCENAMKIAEKNEKVTTYSLRNEKADIYCKNIVVEMGKTVYDVYEKGLKTGTFRLSIPGEHNILNSLPVIYLSRKFGVEKNSIRKKLENFKGAKRRYDILLDEEIKIIDDYAHHPTEIKATIQGAKSIENKKITAIFQPHRYSRTNFLLNEFEGVFEGVDEVFILPVYSAGEENIYGITIEKLMKKIGHKNINKIEEIFKLENKILSEREERVYIFMGAGDISKIAHEISGKMKGLKK